MALGTALRGGGAMSAAERLDAAALRALAKSPRDAAAARAALWAEIRADAAALGEMFSPYREEALNKALFRALHPNAARAPRAEEPKPKLAVVPAPAPQAAPKPPPAARAAAVLNKVARLSLLDTFKIDGRSVGDVTPAEAGRWASKRERDVRFVRALIANLPPDQPIRRHRTAEDAAALYAQAEASDA
jgi:hypothetical protein